MTGEDNGRTGPAKGLAADFAAIAAWWRDAGVDTAFTDRPRRWLEPADIAPEAAGSDSPVAAMNPVPSHAARTPPEPTRFGGDPAGWPRSLAALADWWLTEPSLGLAGDGRRVVPRGPSGAELMVLVPQPEAGDTGHLLAGREGRLLTAVLAAMGLSEERTYVASVLPAHVGPIDWHLLAGGDMAGLLAHHVALAAPRRLLVMGRSVSTLLGHDPAELGPASPHFGDPRLGLPIAYAAELGGLLNRPSRKAAVWRLLLDWGV